MRLGSKMANLRVLGMTSSPVSPHPMNGRDAPLGRLDGVRSVTEFSQPGRRRKAPYLRVFLYFCWIGASILGWGALPQITQPPLVKHKFTLARIRYSTGNFGWFGPGG